MNAQTIAIIEQRDAYLSDLYARKDITVGALVIPTVGFDKRVGEVLSIYESMVTTTAGTFHVTKLTRLYRGSDGKLYTIPGKE